jgi:hypothetical protein
MLRRVLPPLLFVLVAGTASATISPQTFDASGPSSSGDQIHASAQFTFNNLTLTLVLTNLLPNPSSVAQNITDFSFQLLNSQGQNIVPGCTATVGATDCLTGQSLTSLVTVNSNHTYSANPCIGDACRPGWAFTLTSGVFLLNGLGGTHNPAYSIIGPPGGPTYSNAGGSIAGNGPHNPFINQTATWTFNIPGLSPGPITVGHVIFSFGTMSGDIFSCDNSGCGGGGGGQAAPEPVTLLLTGSGLIGLYFIRRRRPGSR